MALDLRSPLVIYHDSSDKKARAALCDNFEGEGDGFARAIWLDGNVFERLPHEDFLFWDYLIRSSRDHRDSLEVAGNLANLPIPLASREPSDSVQVVGFRLHLCLDTSLQRRLRASRLVRASQNVRHIGGGLFDVLFANENTTDYDSDVSHEFGSQVYTFGDDCVVMLYDLPRHCYEFPLTSGVCFERKRLP